MDDDIVLHIFGCEKQACRKIQITFRWATAPIRVVIFKVDANISDVFMQIMADYSLSHNLKIADGLIAATALVYDIEFYTLNLKDFHFIKGIRIYQPKTY